VRHRERAHPRAVLEEPERELVRQPPGERRQGLARHLAGPAEARHLVEGAGIREVPEAVLREGGELAVEPEALVVAARFDGAQQPGAHQEEQVEAIHAPSVSRALPGAPASLAGAVARRPPSRSATPRSPIARTFSPQCGAARSVGELATALGFAHPSVLALTGRMVERGLLDATGDPRDGRVTLLRLTARGVKALQQARPVWDASRRGIEGMLAEVGVDVLGALDALDAALARRGFAGRTLDELAATRPAAKTRKTEAKRR
jgi:DNA-binding MarR family transcriptional regulator